MKFEKFRGSQNVKNFKRKDMLSRYSPKEQGLKLARILELMIYLFENLAPDRSGDPSESPI